MLLYQKSQINPLILKKTKKEKLTLAILKKELINKKFTVKKIKSFEDITINILSL